MSRKTYRIVGIIGLALGIGLLSMAIVQIAPTVRATVGSSLFDRLGLNGGYEQELKAGDYITVIDEKTGAIVDKTSRVVYVGDETIDETNNHYRVTKVKGNKAFAKNLGVAKDIVWRDEWDTTTAGAVVEQARTNMDQTQIAIYHTHSDESYVPTDGTETQPANGGIFKVGSSLAAKLRNGGVTVIDDKTPHEPHDANAYHRSRRTALNLLKNRPVALLDVHRDGVPDPDFYNKQFEGEPITKIRLVVGRQNPHMSTNMEFAKQIKAYMDKHKPGLIKGIFIGKGNYNQDLGPRALLLEVGTHTNSRQRAENGAAIFADALPAVLNIQPAAAPGGGPGKTAPNLSSPGEARGAWSTFGWIIGIVLIGGAAFLFISTGSIQGMKSKLGELRKTEFNNIFGLKKLQKNKDIDRDGRNPENKD